MTHSRCDICGETFTSGYNYNLHRKFAECGGEADGETPDRGSEPTDDDQTGQATLGELPCEASGTLTTYHDDRGFGFITTMEITREQADGTLQPTDVFVHVSDTDVNQLEEGDRLSFTAVRGDEGPRCEDASVIARSDETAAAGDTEGDLDSRHHGFGQGGDDVQSGHGTLGANDADVEGFQDERKFR
jgi:cold shock CspA family protein